jgi:hypothetical protein
MCGLVLFMVGVTDEHAGEAVEGQLAIGLRIGDRLALGGRFSVSTWSGFVAVQSSTAMLTAEARICSMPFISCADRTALLEPLS